jgi:hypothetical protein
MTRNDVKTIASRYNNPILLHALERFDHHGTKWEEMINAAVVELVKQNDYFLNKLIDGRLGDSGLNRLDSAPARKTSTARHGASSPVKAA